MPQMSHLRFLDPKVLSSIASIELKARLLVQGMWASRHRSPYYGQSVEFVDHREYSPGDEPKTIDWKTYARTDRYMVKRFEMESHMNVAILLDASGSMAYAPQSRSRIGKLEYASYMAAGLSYLALHQQDAAGLITFDTGIRDFLPPRQTKQHLMAILARLDGIQPGGETGLRPVCERLAQRLPRRGMVILISDCYDDADAVVDGFKILMARGHEVIVFQLLDHDELEWPFDKLSNFRDLETGHMVRGDPVALREGYLANLRAFLGRIEEGAKSCGMTYTLVDTAEPLERTLQHYLLRRLHMFR